MASTFDQGHNRYDRVLRLSYIQLLVFLIGAGRGNQRRVAGVSHGMASVSFKIEYLP